MIGCWTDSFEAQGMLNHCRRSGIEMLDNIALLKAALKWIGVRTKVRRPETEVLGSIAEYRKIHAVVGWPIKSLAYQQVSDLDMKE